MWGIMHSSYRYTYSIFPSQFSKKAATNNKNISPFFLFLSLRSGRQAPTATATVAAELNQLAGATPL
jgi:hypothetical protein